MTLRSSSCRGLKSTKFGDWLVGILITAIAGWVYWVGNSSLYFSHGDAVWIHDMFSEMFKSSRVMGASFRDFRSGLGIWLSPAIPLLDIPTLMAMAPSGRTNEVVYGASSVASLYFSGWFLSRQFSSVAVTNRISGAILAFVTFLPSPLLWSRVPLQGNYTWMISTSGVALALLVRALSASGRFAYWRDSTLVALALIASVAPWSIWVMTIAGFWAMVGITFIAPGILPKRKLLTAMGTWLIGALVLTFFAVSIWFSIRTTASIVARETAAGYILDLAQPRIWFFDDVYPLKVPRTSLSMYGIIIVFAVGAGNVIGFRSKKFGERLLARVNTCTFALLTVYAFAHFVAQSQQFEIGPSPGYVALFLFPIWTSTIALIPQRLVIKKRTVVVKGHYESDLKTAQQSDVKVRVFNGYVLASLLVVWVLTWTVRNWDLRDTGPFFPREPSAVTAALGQLMMDSGQEDFAGRVLILQPKQSERSGLRNSQLYPTPRVKALRQEFVEAGLPTLTSYSHFNSPEYVRAMSAWFAGGKPFTRTWSVFNDLEVNVARLLGVRFVVSATPIDQGDLIHFLGVYGEDFLYELRDPNLGNFSPTEVSQIADEPEAIAQVASANFEVRRDVVASQLFGRLTSASSVSLTLNPGKVVVDVETSGRSLLVLPIEYSECMRVKSSEGEAQVTRVNYLLTGLLVSESGRYELEVKRNPYSLATCY